MIQFSHYVSDRFALFSLTQGDTAGDNEEYSDETGDDEPGDEVIIKKEDETESILGYKSANPNFAPFQKFSRENELSPYQQELKMVQGKKIICSLDLLLAVFKARCQTPGGTVVPTVHHLCGCCHHHQVIIHINSVPPMKPMRCMQIIYKS